MTDTPTSAEALDPKSVLLEQKNVDPFCLFLVGVFLSRYRWRVATSRITNREPW